MAIALLGAAALASAALGGIGSSRKRRAAKKARRIRRRQRALLKRLTLEGLQEREEDVNRMLGPSQDPDDILRSRLGSQTASRIIGFRGLDPSSSPFKEAQGDLAHERGRRISAISRARQQAESGFATADALEKVDIQLQSALDNLSVIQGLIQGGVVGAGTELLRTSE